MKKLIKKFKLHHLGAISYMIWGAYYIFIARSIHTFSTHQDSASVQSRIDQDAFLLSGFALAVIAIALIFNLRNRKMGWAFNAGLAGFVELSVFTTALSAFGFIAALPGIALYLIGLILTSISIFLPQKNTI